MLNKQDNENINIYEWSKNLTINDKKFLKELVEYLKNLDEWKYFHEDVNLKGK
jgi:hypothetical protein